MTSLNADRDVPEEWSGNEPGEWAPWAFDYFGAPDETQRFVHAIADSEYADTPVDEPGNDDLGALASVVRLGRAPTCSRDPWRGKPGSWPVSSLPLRDHHAPRRPSPRRRGPGRQAPHAPTSTR